MKISIVICTYNRAESLKDPLESLLKQQKQDSLDYEVIVVDNNSSDETKRVVESYMALFHGRLRYVFEQRQGLSHARNRGIREARGEVIAFTDDDVIVSENWIASIKAFMENSDWDGVIGISHWVRQNGEIYTKRPKNDLLIGNGLNMIFRKGTLLKAGLFDGVLGAGSIGCAAEDTDLIYRLTKMGQKLTFCEEIVVHHKPRISTQEEKDILYRDAQGEGFLWGKHLLKHKDIHAFKRLYWKVSDLLKRYYRAKKQKDEEERFRNRIVLSGIWLGFRKAFKHYIIHHEKQHTK